MKTMMAMVVGFLLASQAIAGVVFTPSSWFATNYVFQFRAGVCSYQDYNDTYGTKSDVGAYVQTPVVEWDKAYLSLGWVQLLENGERSGPEFALNTRIGYWWKGCPKYLDWELGGYWVVRTYNGLGFQLGLVNIRF